MLFICLIDKKITTNSTNESENFKMIKKHNKECDDALLIDESLINHFFLRSLEKQARTEIIKEMSLCLVKKGTILFHQGGFGNYFYILKEGALDLLINGDKIIVTEEDIKKILHKKKWSEETISNSINFLLNVRVNMIDNGEVTDSFFVHF